MDTTVLNLVESLFRWIHIGAGVMWIGHLYFFNFVNGNFEATLTEPDVKRKVVPELRPRALYFFRWGAAWTWITGVLLLGMVYYMNRSLTFEPEWAWGKRAIVMVVVVFLMFALYDRLFRMMKDLKVQFVVGLVLSIAVFIGLRAAGFTFRAQLIHMGVMFGTLMAANVWMRIWPNQQRIITAIKNGEKPDADMVALAGLRSRHNTYMSVPLVFAMMGQHAFWASNAWGFPVVILVGWLLTWWLYKKAATVKGF